MIETFDATTIWNRRGKPPVVRIESGKNARINFSVEAVKLLDLKMTENLVFTIDSRDTGIIYFRKDAKKGLPLRLQMVGKSGCRLAVYCRPLAKRLLNHFGFTVDKEKTYVLTTDTSVIDGHEYFFILKSNEHKPLQWRKIR